MEEQQIAQTNQKIKLKLNWQSLCLIIRNIICWIIWWDNSENKFNCPYTPLNRSKRITVLKRWHVNEESIQQINGPTREGFNSPATAKSRRLVRSTNDGPPKAGLSNKKLGGGIKINREAEFPFGWTTDRPFLRNLLL